MRIQLNDYNPLGDILKLLDSCNHDIFSENSPMYINEINRLLAKAGVIVENISETSTVILLLQDIGLMRTDGPENK